MTQPFDNRDGDLLQIEQKDAEIERLKAEVDMQIRIGAKILRKYSATQPLLTRAADALAFEMMGRHSQIEIRDHSELIAELRKAAK